MPGLDEEFRQEATQAASGLAMRFLYSLPGRLRPATNRLGLASKAHAARASAELDAQSEADRKAIEAAWERHAAGKGPAPSGVDGHVAGGVAFRTLASPTPEGAGAISAALAERGIEHYASVEDMLDTDPGSDKEAGYGAEEISAYDFGRVGRAGNGLYEVFVPDRAAAEDPAPRGYPYRAVIGGPGRYALLSEAVGAAAGTGERDIGAFLDEHDVEAVKARAALARACGLASGEVLWGDGLAPDPAELEAMGVPGGPVGGEVALEVVTVPWDPEAKIVTDNLASLGVPFRLDVAERASGRQRGLAVVTVGGLHAGYAKQVVDALASGVRGFTRERVRNYGELERAALEGAPHPAALTDRAFRSAPLPAAALHKVTCALQEMGIEHEVIETPEDGTFEVMVMESEVRAKGFMINRAAETLAGVRPPEAKARAQAAYEGSAGARANRERARARVEGARERESAAARGSRGAEKVSRDVRLATKSAEAQRRAAGEVVRRKSLGL